MVFVGNNWDKVLDSEYKKSYLVRTYHDWL